MIDQAGIMTTISRTDREIPEPIRIGAVAMRAVVGDATLLPS